MKKLLSLAAAFLLCAGVQAQIVSSRSVSIKSAQKQPSETQWFLRGGLNVMKMTGDGAEDTGSKLGYNFVYGFQKPLGSVGTYWGMEFGLGSRGWKVEENESDYEYSLSLMAHNVQVSPFTFGYKYNITDALAVDAQSADKARYGLKKKNPIRETVKKQASTWATGKTGSGWMQA